MDALDIVNDRDVFGAAPPLAGLLDDLCAYIRRFVVLTDDQAVAVTLWTAHTFVYDAFDSTPYLAVTSPEKRSGKSRLFDVFELIVSQPWRAITPTEAVTFRKIERDRPTFLLDEVDASAARRRLSMRGCARS